MIKAKKILSVLGASLIVSAGVYGCGKASNNDQGASFTNEAYWLFVENEWLMINEATVRSNVDSNFDKVNNGAIGSPPAVHVAMKVGNKLTNQFINVKRVDCSYQLPGADPSLVIPNDSALVSVYLPHAEYKRPMVVQDVDVHPDDIDNGEVVHSSQHVYFPIASAQLYQYLSVNRNSLPELPYTVIATCAAVGVSQAGDTLTTNDANFQLNFYEPSECCDGDDGFQRGVGTGGDYDSYTDYMDQDLGGATLLEGDASVEESADESVEQ